jgi:hypothetical protein
MVVAMMLPLVRGAVRTTAARSLWIRRNRAIAGFLVGYAGVWTVVGAGAIVVLLAVGAPDRGTVAAAGAFAAAALWHRTRARARAVMACHRTMPLAPRGWRADRDCFRYGWGIGVSCVSSCWAVMAACLLLHHSLAAMTYVSVLTAAERFTPRPDPGMMSLAWAAAAAMCVAVATL